MIRPVAGPELKSERVKDALRGAIVRGDLRVGEQIPSEPALVERFGVSRSTVREAVTSLAAEGLVTRAHGKGTFVCERPVRHKTVAVVMPYLFVSPNSPLRAGMEVIPSLTQAIEAECRRRGMSIMLYLSNNDPLIERENLRQIPQRSIDAAIVNYMGGSANIDCLCGIQAAGLPLVMIDTRADDVDCTTISTDNRRGAYEATTRLLEAGARSVSYLTGPVCNSALVDRRAGYLDAMARAALAPDVVTLDDGAMEPAGDPDSACGLALRSIRAVCEPHGILTADAVILSGVVRAGQALSLRSDYYLLACFDEPVLNNTDAPAVIKVVQPFDEIGRLSVETIEEELSGETQKGQVHRRIELPPRIELVGRCVPANGCSRGDP